MLCCRGFELFSRWVPLKGNDEFNVIRLCE